LAVFVGFDGGRAVEVQVVEVITKLEVGLHHLVPGDRLAGMTGGAAHERREVRVDRSLCFIMRPIVADAVDEDVPLVLPRTVSVLCGRPCDVGLLYPLVLEHVDGSGVRSAGELCGALGAVNVRGEVTAGFVDSAKPTERLGSVGEGELHRVDVDVLPAVFAAWYAATQADHRNRPGILDPAALVDLVD